MNQKPEALPSLDQQIEMQKKKLEEEEAKLRELEQKDKPAVVQEGGDQKPE